MDVKARRIIDIHAHVLPGMDDGARDMEEACALLCKAAAQGILAVVATPHDTGGRNREELTGIAGQIKEEVCRTYPGFNLYVGQEAFYHEGLSGELRTGEALTMVGSRYVLVEFHPSVSYGNLYRGIRAIFAGGYRPVLAHMERYQCLRREENLHGLTRAGCLFQMNYSSLQGGMFDPEVRWCRRQVLAGRIDLLGTDMHRIDYRPPDIIGAMKWLEHHVEERRLSSMTWEKPLEIISAR